MLLEEQYCLAMHCFAYLQYCNIHLSTLSSGYNSRAIFSLNSYVIGFSNVFHAHCCGSVDDPEYTAYPDLELEFGIKLGENRSLILVEEAWKSINKNVCK